MPRKRTTNMINTKLFTDKSVANLPSLKRIFCIGLWCCSDNGRLEYDPVKLKSLIMPYDDVNVEQFLEELISEKLIISIVFNGKKYIHFVDNSSEVPVKKVHRREVHRKAGTKESRYIGSTVHRMYLPKDVPSLDVPKEQQSLISNIDIQYQDLLKSKDLKSKDLKSTPKVNTLKSLTPNVKVKDYSDDEMNANETEHISSPVFVPLPGPVEPKPEHIEFVDCFAQTYEAKVGCAYKADKVSFITAFKLIKSFGRETVVHKARILADMCDKQEQWWCKDGWASFTVEKLSKFWNQIIERKEKTDEDKWASIFSKIEGGNNGNDRDSTRSTGENSVSADGGEAVSVSG